MDETDDDLHCSVAHLEQWALRCGLLVVAGLVIEVILAYRQASPGSSVNAIWWPVVADFLVALGVAGEIGFSRRASIRQEELQRRAALTVAEANERARQAMKDAEEARERTAKLEQLTAWRHVPKQGRAQLVDFLKRVEVPVCVLIEYQSGDPEAFSYAAELADIFKDAGIRVRGNANAYIGIAVFGLHITGADELNIAAISGALECAGISLGGTRDERAGARLHGDPKPNLYIFVGAKQPASL